MVTKAKQVTLGPFKSGMNTASDPSAVAEDELVDIVNFELDNDFSLRCRPPINTVQNSGTWADRILILGAAVIGANTWMIGSNTSGVWKFTANTWSLITNTFTASCFVQYKDKIWLVPKPGSANPGGSWDGTTFTAIAAIPKGEAAVIYKERMWIAPGIASTTNASRLIFSAVADPGTWNAADFFDVSPGDGQKLVDLMVLSNNLLLFKNDSTFGLAYDTRPVDAAITKISNTIGATGPRCVAIRQDEIFVYHEGNVYQLVNFNWFQINTKVPFTYDSSAPSTRIDNVFLSVMGDRLIVRYFNTIYVFDLINRAWSRWKSESSLLHNFGPLHPLPSDVTQNVNNLYYGGSSISNSTKFYAIADGFDILTVEKADGVTIDIECSVLTKNYDIDLPHKFKRLYWWGCEAVTSRDITGIATPIIPAFEPTWGDLLAYTWDSLGTWDSPLAALSVSTTVFAGTSSLRRFIKFLKSMRFRRINFTIGMLSSGSVLDGPAKLYTLTIAVNQGQLVTAAVS